MCVTTHMNASWLFCQIIKLWGCYFDKNINLHKTVISFFLPFVIFLKRKCNSFKNTCINSLLIL